MEFESENYAKSINNKPWPIVEAQENGPGMQLLSLNSEHLMRRIVCEVDAADSANSADGIDPSVTVLSSNDSSPPNDDLISLYNEGLGQGMLSDRSLDTIYTRGSVAALGYGVDKYVLLKVGPFPDLYETMARQHYARGDEASALIAAETANGKCNGNHNSFASTFRFYARLLSSFPSRREETRDAARQCLQPPFSLSTIGMAVADFEEVAVLGEMADAFDAPEVALAKLKTMYELMRSVQKDQVSNNEQQQMSRELLVLDQADALMNNAVLSGAEWSSVRPQLAELFRSVGKEEMAAFVDT